MQITEGGRLLTAGVVGLGNRGHGQLELIHNMADVKVLAVCDKYQDRVDAGLAVVPDARGPRDYHEILAMPEWFSSLRTG